MQVLRTVHWKRLAALPGPAATGHRARPGIAGRALALTAVALALRSGVALGDDPRDVSPASLVSRLGDTSWSVREASQQELIRLGERALPAVEKALDAPQPEVALRARQILDVLDPEIVLYHLARMHLDKLPGVAAPDDDVGDANAPGGSGSLPAPRVAQFVSGSSIPGEVASLEPPDEEGALAADVTFRFKSTELPRGELEIDATAQYSRSRQPSALDAVARTPGTISLLDRGERVHYLQIGQHSERARQRFLWLLQWQRGRRSKLSASSEDGASDFASWSAWLERLRRQATDENAAASGAAIEILGLAGDSASQTVATLREALGRPALEATARLALARLGDEAAVTQLREQLREAIDSGLPAADQLGPAGDPDEDEGVASPPLLESALLLLNSRTPEAWEYISLRLGNLDQRQERQVHAAFAHFLKRAATHHVAHTPESLARALFRPDVLAQVTWGYRETQDLYSLVLESLSGDDPAHRDLVYTLLQGLAQELPQRGTRTASSTAPALLQLWDVASRRFDLRPVAMEFIPQLVANVASHNDLGRLAVSLRRTYEGMPVDEALFARLAADMRAEVGNASSTGRSSLVHGLLVQLSRTLTFSAQQLETIVGLLLAAADSSRTSYRTDILAELERLTGIVASESPDGPNNRRVLSSAAAVAAMKPRVQRWQGSSAAIAASLEALAQRDDARPPDAVGPELELAEFDLHWTRARTVTGEGNRSGEEKDDGDSRATDQTLRVLDARVLRVREGVPYRYEDRWDNEVVGVVRRSTASAGRTRYRVESAYTATEDIPVLVQPRNRLLRTGWYESSDSRLGVYSVSTPSAADRLSTLVLVREDEGDEPSPLADAQSPAERWRIFRSNLIDGLDELTSSTTLRSVLRLIDTLQLRESLPALRRAFEKRPEISLARFLLEQGDQSPLPYLLQKLENGRSTEVNEAAQVLTEHGDPRGLRKLIEILSDAERRLQPHQALSSFEKLLFTSDAPPAVRHRALEFIIENIHQPSYWTRGFQILDREAGATFGLAQTYQIRDRNERRRAQQAVVQSALAWWESRNAKRDGDE